jgi:hypothetical protein
MRIVLIALIVLIVAPIVVCWLLYSLRRKVDIMNAQIQALVDKVTEETTVVAGLTTVIASLSTGVDNVVAGLAALKTALDNAIANGGLSAEDKAALLDTTAKVTANVAALQSDVTGVQSNTQEMADALVVNTPSN